jgi:carbon-monoxide dehydrogenase large subunit
MTTTKIETRHNPTIEGEFRIGAPVRRVEDARFTQGLGRYVDDMFFSRQAYMVVVRSPHAAAQINSIDTRKALALSGVLAVLTGEDAAADGLGGMHTVVQRFRRDGTPMPRPPYRILAVDAVRFTGDAVAIVVAETCAIAEQGAELIEIDYTPIDSVTDVVEAVKPGASAVWPTEAPDNVCFYYQEGNKAAVNAAFARAQHISTLKYRISRVSANPMEPRTAIGLYDPANGRYTLYASTQAPHKIRTELAEYAFCIPANRLRVVSNDVGGGFGMKGSPYPEYAMVLWAGRRIGRPVRWTATRSESFISDFHGRDNVATVQLALDGHGHFLALRLHSLGNLGAYLAFNTPHPSAGNLGSLAGAYRTPHIHAEVSGVFTNTQPNAPYRGAGRPEASYAIERIIDVAAYELGIDRAELRRRNLISKQEMPFKTGLTYTYDSGDFIAGFETALRVADWRGFETRRKNSARHGRLRGISIVYPVAIAGGPFNNPNEECVEIRFNSNGDAALLLGTHNHGQGHETAFRQLASSLLGLDAARVEVLAGDTDVVVHGRGTFGSRSLAAGGTAMVRAAEKIIERGKAIASHVFEADVKDLKFAKGQFYIDGTDRSLSIEEVAKISYVPGKLPASMECGFAEVAIVQALEATFPNSCHICELEVDPETGVINLANYVVADDVGAVVNPMLVEGQMHGGIAQGLGQALAEQIIYDPQTGQILTGSFMDYTMPRALDLPPITMLSNPIPTPNNPLGVKGAGEAGTVGALPAVINAVVHALHPLGITHIDMPATPDKVWAAIRAAKARQTVKAKL